MKMKPIIAGIGVTLLCFPLWRYASFNQRVEDASSTTDLLSTLFSVGSGFTIGGIGLTLLGILIDGGSGYRRPILLVMLSIIGIMWIAYYPSGWLLGIPLIIYPLSKGFGMLPKNNVQK